MPLARQKLLDALKLTLPTAFHKKTGAFLPEKLNGFELNKLECYIWMELANAEFGEQATFSYQRLYRKVEQSPLFSPVERNKMLTSICYNLTVELLKVDPTDSQILEYCHKGISIELSSNQHVYLGALYYNQARYHFAQNEIEHAKKLFQQSHDFYTVIQNIEMAEKVYHMVQQEHGITLVRKT